MAKSKSKWPSNGSTWLIIILTALGAALATAAEEVTKRIIRGKKKGVKKQIKKKH